MFFKERAEMLELPDPDAVEEKLNELGLPLSEEINYRLESVFPKLEGFMINGSIKKKARLVQQVEPKLLEMLYEGEQVLFVAKGNQSSFSEQFFMGALWAQHINHAVFVLTTLRIIMLRSNSKGTPKKTCWHIYYNQVTQLKSTWLGNLNLVLADGKSSVFTGIPKLDKKIMKGVFEEALVNYEKFGLSPEVSQSRENLCSHCHHAVPKNEYDCEKCEATFWKPSEVAIRSFVLPCWGDFVMGHTMLALFELMGFGFLLLIAVVSFLNHGSVLGPLLMIFFASSMDAFITARIASKGLHPRKLPRPEVI